MATLCGWLLATRGRIAMQARRKTRRLNCRLKSLVRVRTCATSWPMRSPPTSFARSCALSMRAMCFAWFASFAHTASRCRHLSPGTGQMCAQRRRRGRSWRLRRVARVLVRTQWSVLLLILQVLQALVLRLRPAAIASLLRPRSKVRVMELPSQASTGLGTATALLMALLCRLATV